LPEDFSVAHARQIVPAEVVAGIAGFIRAFDRVTGREAKNPALVRLDAKLAVPKGRRQSEHTPETHVLSTDNVDMLAQRNGEFVFRPAHGFASRGLLDAATVGRARLRQALKRGELYVAQRRIAKLALEVEGVRLWTDLRVWAYRGDIILMSGRASRRPDRLDLAPPGGWLPTYASP